MKLRFVCAFCLITVLGFGQSKKSTSMDKVTLDELKMTKYQKDTTANALVLYEHGNFYLNLKKKNKFTTDFYFRVKILKREGFNKATINIPYYDKSELHDIEAVTYNLSKDNRIVKSSLVKDKIYIKERPYKWKEKSFTLPNIKVGSVIEYKYSITSRGSQLNDWKYQSDIPKLKSDFSAAILGNLKYNIRIVGKLKLTRDSAYVKNGCVFIPGIGIGSCSVIEYGMDAIPAFKEQPHMLSKDNFLSRLSFKLKSSTNVKGQVTNYTKTWRYADKNLKTRLLDGQNSKKKYFKKILMQNSLLGVQNTLERAKKVSHFIQNHYTWNREYRFFKKIKVKEAFELKKGNVFDINLSLYYAMQAANINSELVLLSTRDIEVPTKLYPVISEFNYLIVKTVINNKVYFLDAVNKNLPFGLIQFESLNGDGRVMDFKNGSFWEKIKLNKKTTKSTRLDLRLTSESLTGNVSIKRAGYFAVNFRDRNKARLKKDILEDIETKYPDIEIDNYELKQLNDKEKPIYESYDALVDLDIASDNKMRINPFLVGKKTVNPFKLEQRDYPVDFGCKRANTYLIKLTIPKGYKVVSLPKNVGLAIPNKGGKILFNVNQKENTINMYLKYTINKKTYNNKEYFYLKKFYQKLIDIQNSFIVLEKI